jgi:hypothetical protein
MLHAEEPLQNFIHRPPGNVRRMTREADFAIGSALE